MILKSELNAKNTITAVSAVRAAAVLVWRHNFGTIKWRLEGIKKKDMQTRWLLTMYTAWNLKHRLAISENERRYRLVTNCSDIPSIDN
jgi:hypothetical protein